ncbi:23S rRNA (uracil(1939)-C(5))-methyltransferase RlmD [Lachnospiraceae bacterium MD1]|uniref:23S rRNA (Uracil(1939)-C(5))-methyltransferase RlmD n=1 Tax=Variimorphobacter saccharofermentans TaxID=2755051 RepID=A0A839K2K4_9FIRM|nr:23S rRNA (uracil(1939)-C(5))-methyltransferase RlmD [Variimorphobacter saccharofermentans]MBB2183607.1 23S rRNA (uracil(1939)-C(5))-methyltransferase RlmD [Variimorphobacter saccharofermentans]
MKKGQIYEGIVQRVDFPNKGVVEIEGNKVIVKNVVPGQKISFAVNKKRAEKYEGKLLEVLEKSPLETREKVCKHFGNCGGCSYQTMPYEDQLEMKKGQVKRLIDSVCKEYEFEGILASPTEWGYRNKMEFSFGDEYKGGPLALGLHKKGSFHDILTVDDCAIVDKDYNMILNCVLKFASDHGLDYYHKLSHTGYLRHLLVRKAVKTQEILINLITTSQLEEVRESGENYNDKDSIFQPLVEQLRKLPLQGNIVGILHTNNDSQADVVKSDYMEVLYGRDYIYEELLGLKFKISTFSFFQTNSLGAEVLYSKVREYVGETKDRTIFDLYSGTGTIAQLLAPVAKKVTGVEIVEEAVEAARENASLNGLSNCEFIAGDVLKVIDSLKDKPDIIVLDPPRDGIHPKALDKIIDFSVKRIVYISCKPTSLARDLDVFLAKGYEVEKVCAVDMFPGTVHVETVCLLSKKA